MKKNKRSYTLEIKHSKYCEELALSPNHSLECDRASPIAPVSQSTTGSDTPIYFVIDKNSKKATITLKDGFQPLIKWNTPIDKPTLHLGWQKIAKAVKHKEIVFRNKNEQILFTNLVKKSFGYDRRIKFEDLLKNKYSFIE